MLTPLPPACSKLDSERTTPPRSSAVPSTTDWSMLGLAVSV